MFRIEVSEQADLDMMSISDYLYEETHDMDFATNFALKIAAKIKNRLSTFPKSGKVEFVNDDNNVYRQIVVGSYYVFYRIVENEGENFVLITNVIHSTGDKDRLVHGFR